MSLYRDLVNSAAGQGVDLNWSYKPYQPSPYGGGEGGNDPRENSIEKIAPTLTFNGVNYSYNPDTQTFSSGGDETKDPKLGWGRTYDLTTPEGTTQQRERSRTELETAMPALLTLTGVLGLGALGAAGAGGLGSLTAGEAVAGGIAPELIGGGLGGAGEAALTGIGGEAVAGGIAPELIGGGFGGFGEAALTGIGGEIAPFTFSSLSAPGSLADYTLGGTSLTAPETLLSSAASSFGADGTISGAMDALYNAATAGPGMTSNGSSGPSKLPGSPAKPSDSSDNNWKDLLKLGIAGLGAASSGSRSAIKPVGYKGPDPKARRWDPGAQTYYSNATGERIYKAAAGGGISGLPRNEYRAGGQYLRGPGDGMSDNIKANIDGVQEARLADGEFVIPADVVSHIGNGSSNAGAKKLHAMMNRIRRARTGNPKQGKQIRAEKYLPV